MAIQRTRLRPDRPSLPSRSVRQVDAPWRSQADGTKPRRCGASAQVTVRVSRWVDTQILSPQSPLARLPDITLRSPGVETEPFAAGIWIQDLSWENRFLGTPAVWRRSPQERLTGNRSPSLGVATERCGFGT